MRQRVVRARSLLIVLAGVMAGCTSTGVAVSSSPAASSSPVAVASPSAPAPAPTQSSEVASASPALTPIPGCLPDCLPGRLTEPGELPAGDYTTENWFGGQFTVTLPAGWSSFEDSTGEFALRPVGTETGALIFWLDVYPIVDGEFTRVPGVEESVDGTFSWLESNPNLDTTDREPATLGGLPATAVELEPSPDATNVDPDCPPELRPCVGLFSFPQWDGGFFSEGGAFRLRLVAADATWGGERHVIYAMVDAQDAETYAEIAPVAAEIIEGARLPLGVTGG